MKLTDVKERCKIALNAGCEVSTHDYGFSAGCRRKGEDKWLMLAEVYRPERDGYSGHKLIALDLLKELLENSKWLS